MKRLTWIAVFFVVASCGTAGPPKPDEQKYPTMDMGDGTLGCSGRSVLQYQGFCYPSKAAEIACSSSLRYYIPQDCGAAGFPDGR